MAKFLVTGGAGFIGSSIADKLVADGEDVVVLDNLSEGKLENIEPIIKGIKFIKGDIRDERDLAKAMNGVDYVIHQAALRSVPKSMTQPMEYNDVNVNGTLKLLIKAKEKKVKRVVFASSSSIYGNTDRFPQRESDPVNPVSPYAATKLIGEDYCKLFYNAYGLETVCLRYFNVFGPKQSLDNQYAVVIPKFITCILKDENPPVHGDGLQERDFTFINNVVEANIKAALTKGIAGEVFNVACGDAHSVMDIIHTVNKILGKDVKAIHEPTRIGDVRKTLADITKLKTKMGIKEFIHFEEGIRATIKYFDGKIKAGKKKGKK